jgi:hypothetical protein
MTVQVAVAQLQGALSGISLDRADDEQLLELVPVLQVTLEAREHSFPVRGEKTVYTCNKHIPDTAVIDHGHQDTAAIQKRAYTNKPRTRPSGVQHYTP